MEAPLDNPDPVKWTGLQAAALPYKYVDVEQYRFWLLA